MISLRNLDDAVSCKYSIMEAINSGNNFSILGDGIFLLVPTTESIFREVFGKFNFRKEPGLLQFWTCSTPSDSEDIGCNLILTDQTYILTPDHLGLLQEYRRKCLGNDYPFVGLETNVGNWLPGRAAQTRIADQRTKHHVLNQEDQHSADIGEMGQLVLPVFYDQGAGNKLVGIIELVTPIAKESYGDDFKRIHNLLKDVGLTSNYMGKTIKVEYNHMIKFTLPLSAKFTALQSEVTKRFKELNGQNFHIEYDDTEGNRLPISSDENLHVCMGESSSRGSKFIRMRVMLNTSGVQGAAAPGGVQGAEPLAGVELEGLKVELEGLKVELEGLKVELEGL